MCLRKFAGEDMTAIGTSLKQTTFDREQPIALREAAMVPAAMLHWRDKTRGRHVIWFLGNTSSLHAFVKGASFIEHLERSVGV